MEVSSTDCSKLINVYPTTEIIIEKKYNRISDKLPDISIKADRN